MKWINVNDRTPSKPRTNSHKKTYLICSKDGVGLAEFSDMGRWDSEDSFYTKVTHWMSLPEDEE